MNLPDPERDWPDDTCQQCGRVLRGGMLCGACQYGTDATAPGCSEDYWAEPKVVVYESGQGLVVAGYVRSQWRADQLMKNWEVMGKVPRLTTVEEVRQRQAEARAEHPAPYRPRRKD